MMYIISGLRECLKEMMREKIETREMYIRVEVSDRREMQIIVE